MLQIINIIVSSYVLTLFIIGAMVTLGVDARNINGQDTYIIVLQTILIMIVLKKIRRFIYGRR